MGSHQTQVTQRVSATAGFQEPWGCWRTGRWERGAEGRVGRGALISHSWALPPTGPNLPPHPSCPAPSPGSSPTSVTPQFPPLLGMEKGGAQKRPGAHLDLGCGEGGAGTRGDEVEEEGFRDREIKKETDRERKAETQTQSLRGELQREPGR